MLASEDGWEATTTFATKVLQDLRREEQKRTEIKKTTQEKKLRGKPRVRVSISVPVPICVLF